MSTKPTKSTKLTPAAARALHADHTARLEAQAKVAAAAADVQAATTKLAELTLARFPKEVVALEAARARAAAVAEDLAAAERACAKTLAKHLVRMPPAEPGTPGSVVVTGIVVTHSQKKSQRTFRIAQYLDEGNPLTARMKPHYGDGTVTDSYETAEAPA